MPIAMWSLLGLLLLAIAAVLDPWHGGLVYAAILVFSVFFLVPLGLALLRISAARFWPRLLAGLVCAASVLVAVLSAAVIAGTFPYFVARHHANSGDYAAARPYALRALERYDEAYAQLPLPLQRARLTSSGILIEREIDAALLASRAAIEAGDDAEALEHAQRALDLAVRQGESDVVISNLEATVEALR
ncbi:MAG: hypothetical protein IBX63_10560 [Coriobacteriia bacterium]|nr:hypothetical protein [Coriobacteriia bacterium]